jgi:hypothetical protein
MNMDVDEQWWRATKMTKRRNLAYKAVGGLPEYWMCAIFLDLHTDLLAI